MKRSTWLFLVLSAGVTSGCTPVVSLNPLYKDAKAEKPYLDPRIEGEWILANLEEAEQNDDESKPPCKVKVRLDEGRDVSYSVEFACPDSNSGPRDESSYETRRYDLRLVRLGTATFFDAQFQELKGKEKDFVVQDVTDSGVAPAHLLGEVWAQQDFVRFSPMSSEWTEKNWPGEQVVKVNDGRRFGGNVNVLTNATDSLREGIARNDSSDEAFGFPFYLCRPKADCDKRAVDDVLARKPENSEALAGGVAFYAKRGDFMKAAALQKQAVEVATDAEAKKTGEFQLGKLLLFRGEYGAARDALASAKEPGKPPSIEELVVQSYFMEGDYQGAIKAAKSVPAPAELRSADPILLSYFALYRLGRTKEAEVYLREQVAGFVGPAEEHFYLLEATRRVSGTWEARDLKRSSYYLALDSIRKGDIETSRAQLENLAKMRPENDLVGVAAKIELERLKSPAKK